MEDVPPLVAPMPPELATAIPARLDPHFFFERVGPEDFLAPAGSVALMASEAVSGELPPGGTVQTQVVANVAGDYDRFAVAGVVVSPVEDAQLTARHEEELAVVAVAVSGTHTILAAASDCAALFPFDRIRLGSEPAGYIDVGPPGEQHRFRVPRYERAAPDDPAAFAMVLQKGASELRVLLLGPRPQTAPAPPSPVPTSPTTI